MIKFENHTIYSDNGFVKRKSDNLIAKKIAAIRYNSDDYEEVDTIPNIINEEEYKSKVEQLIRQRYSISDELGLIRQKDIKREEYEEYYTFVEMCKKEAKQ